MQSEEQVYFLINHKVTRGLCFIQTCEKIRHVSPQNRFTLKEFETTTREIGLIIFRHLAWSPDTDKEIFRVSLLKTTLPFLTNQAA